MILKKKCVHLWEKEVTDFRNKLMNNFVLCTTVLEKSVRSDQTMKF